METDQKFSIPLGSLIIGLIILNTAIGVYYDLQNIVVQLLLPGVFILAFVLDLKNLNRSNREFILYTTFVVLSLIGIFYYNNHADFETDFRRLLAAFFASYIALGFVKNKSSEIFFHIGYIISMIALILIEYNMGNFSLTGFATAKGLRDRFYFNANYYSYISYFANFSLFYLHLKFRNKVTLLLCLILPLLFLILAFITQSRSGLLLIILINGCFWFLVNLSKESSPWSKIARTMLLIVAAIALAFQFLNFYQNSQIQQRVSDNSDESRAVLALEGLRVFTDYPLTGVGLGQFPNYNVYNQFSHNSYTEVLAEHGILGGFIIITLFALPLLKSIRNLRHNRINPIYRLNFLFFFTFLLYNNAYVFYKFSFSMMYFFLIIAYQNKISSGSISESHSQMNK